MVDPISAIAGAALSLLASFLKKKAEQLSGKVVNAVKTAAGKKAEELHEVIKAKFGEKSTAKKALEDLTEVPDDPDRLVSVQEQLTESMRDDDTFASQIVEILEQAAEAGADQVFNTNIYGEVKKFVQMRDVYGDVTI